MGPKSKEISDFLRADAVRLGTPTFGPKALYDNSNGVLSAVNIFAIIKIRSIRMAIPIEKNCTYFV